jgi:putative copper export protein/methionine-rich copper-binding protein CopC
MTGPRLGRPFRRAWLLAGAVAAGLAVGVFAGGEPASAHALAVSSNPPPGATLAQAPTTVTIVFSEAPDPRLSTIEVLDSGGSAHQVGHSSPVAGEANTLQVAVGPLSPGVYSVNWRTISRVDGHLANGSFAFGVKVAPTGAGATSAVVRSPPASTWAVAARWAFYVGVMGLVGTAVIALLAPPRRLRWFALGAWLVAGVGVVALEEQQRRNDDIPLGSLFGSSLGHQFLWRGLPLLAAALFVALFIARPTSRFGPFAVGGAALVAMFGDVEASHVSGERSWRWFHLLSQWVHFAAAGIWLGGLAALLVILGTLDNERRRNVIRRFSNLALISVLVVAASGVLRGLDEIRSWHGLFDTTFGKWAILKVCLLFVLLVLGLLQRTRGVPDVSRGSPRLLRRIGSSELALAAVVLVATGFLQSLAPPSATTAPKPAKPLVVAGQDFGTTVRVRLEISPGTPGFNRFTLQALDYDTLKPVAAQIVPLTFDIPSRPDLGSSTLTLSRQKDGEFSAVAPNLSVDGTWTITVLIQRGSQSAQVPLTVTTKTVPVKIDVSRSPGLPTVYTIHVTPTASFQVYLDPGRPGFNEFHVTVLAAGGNEISTSSLSVHAARAAGAVASLTARRLDTIGHFVADLPGAARGSYHFSIDATTDQGTLHADITIPIP